jgi:hypothetical protein
MGEQSVGKSFTLNHLVDTSFAGSAMRTTGLFRVTSQSTSTEHAQRESGCPCHLRRTHLSWRWISKVSITCIAPSWFTIRLNFRARQASIVSSVRLRKTHFSSFSTLQSQISCVECDTVVISLFISLYSQVLFRNNFALSRDISGLFQSFQSSSSVLDPASNPSLFQSTLVVIIKVRITCFDRCCPSCT